MWERSVFDTILSVCSSRRERKFFTLNSTSIYVLAIEFLHQKIAVTAIIVLGSAAPAFAAFKWYKACFHRIEDHDFHNRAVCRKAEIDVPVLGDFASDWLIAEMNL